MSIKRSTAKNSRWNRFGFLIVAGIIGLASVLYIYIPGGWAWETPIARSFPAVAVDMPPTVTSVTMTLEESSADVSLAIAPTEAGVRDFWTSAVVPPVEGTVVCDGAGKDTKAMRCERSGASLTVHLPADPGAARASGRRTFWVIPYQQTSFQTVHAVTSLRWARLEVTRAQGARIEVDAAACVNRDERISRERCIFADELLGRPQLGQSRDPERLVAVVAKWSAHQVVPVVVTSMAIVDGMLALSIVTLLGVWLRGKGIGRAPRDGQPIDAYMLLRGYRHTMALLETLGPSVAISATVLGLILAFDPSVFADRDGSAFGNAIRMAMGASFCGLTMRVLAHCADRLIEHLTMWNASEDGLIYPVDGPDTAEIDESGEERPRDTGARPIQRKARSAE